MTGSLLTGAAPTAPLARRNPVAKVAAGLILTLVLFATVDPLTPAIAIGIELAVLPLFGLRYGAVARRSWPVLATVAGVLVSLILFGADRTGAVLVPLGPIPITTGLLTSALGLSLRLIAVSLPGVLIFATTDPTDLADALIQNVRAPARFAIGTLAAFRLVPLLGAEYRLLRLARRARGVDAGRNPLAAIRIAAATLFALLVGTIRRATRLATAMDARGFDSGVRRSHARTQSFGPADAALIGGALVAAALALGVSVYTGFFAPLLG